MKHVPTHIAIIMDGNRRWARRRGLKATIGHRYMVEKGIRRVVRTAEKLGVKYLTLWALSTENWDRDPQEINFLMKLFRELFTTEAEAFHRENVRLRTIGDLSRFDKDIQKNIKKWVGRSSKNTGITVILALNYGGRDELLRAIQRYVREKTNGKKLTAKQFAHYLDTTDIPDPDLIIRPGGEQRLSGFLLWQSNYAELYFTKTLMPDFDAAALRKAVAEFSRRQRRFGK